MNLHNLYRNGVITFDEYHQRLMAKFDATLSKADALLKEMEAKKCTK